MYVKEGIDARTFPQIWETLTPAEQSSLREAISNACGVSRTTIYNWTKGISPVSVRQRKQVATTMGKELGAQFFHVTLFPMDR